MNNVTCPRCSTKFPLKSVLLSSRGRNAVCTYCGEQFETDEEVELNKEQIRRINEVDNAVYQLCNILVEDQEPVWDIGYISEISDFVVNTLALAGYRVRYPAVVHDEDREYIAEYPEFPLHES